MDWKLAIRKNREALAQIVAGLFLLAGWQKGEKPPEYLGPITIRRLKTALRKAEAALRRLIVLYVNTQGVKPSKDMKPHDVLPDFASFSNASSARVPSFNLFDPRKRIVFFFDEENSYSSSSGHPPQRPSLDELHSSADQRFTNCAALTCKACSVTEGDYPYQDSMADQSSLRGKAKNCDPQFCQPMNARSLDSEQEENNAKTLLHRLAALNHALKNLPQQARRLARLLEKRKQAPSGPGRVPPIRAGFAPGHCDRGEEEVDLVLHECHGLLRDWEVSPP